MCCGKRNYKTLESVKKAVWLLNQKYNREYNINFCKLCNNYHLTIKK